MDFSTDKIFKKVLRKKHDHVTKTPTEEMMKIKNNTAAISDIGNSRTTTEELP